MFSIFNCFSTDWRIGERYKAERIGESAEPCPMPMLISKKEEMKSFQ